MFNNLIPAKGRAILYALYQILGVVVGSIAVAFLAINRQNPEWFAVAIAVYGYLGGVFGKLAGDNTPTVTTGGTVA